jgi:hypothetical protein
MSNKNPKNQISSSKQASEMGKKGGANKKGYKSFKTVIKEIFESGEIDQKEFIKSHIMQAMQGNSGVSKILFEYHDGKVKDEVELNGNMQTKIEILPVRPIADKDT